MKQIYQKIKVFSYKILCCNKKWVGDLGLGQQEVHRKFKISPENGWKFQSAIGVKNYPFSMGPTHSIFSKLAVGCTNGTVIQNSWQMQNYTWYIAKTINLIIKVKKFLSNLYIFYIIQDLCRIIIGAGVTLRQFLSKLQMKIRNMKLFVIYAYEIKF